MGFIMPNETTVTPEDRYCLLDLFPNDVQVKVFTVLGRTLSGKILHRSKGSILVKETQTNKQAYINLDHTISVNEI